MKNIYKNSKIFVISFDISEKIFKQLIDLQYNPFFCIITNEKINIEWLKLCDAVLCLTRSHHYFEIQWANENDIPVFYTIESLKNNTLDSTIDFKPLLWECTVNNGITKTSYVDNSKQSALDNCLQTNPHIDYNNSMCPITMNAHLPL